MFVAVRRSFVQYKAFENTFIEIYWHTGNLFVYITCGCE